MSVENICWYWIYHANSCRMNVSWVVSGCPSGALLVNIYISKYIFVLDICCNPLEMEICSQQRGEFFLLLDISCQQLGDECKLGSFCAPFRAGDTFFKTYICVGNNQENNDTPLFVIWNKCIFERVFLTRPTKK